MMKCLRVLYKPYSSNTGIPGRFVVSPSVHRRLVSYEQWRLCHFREVLAGLRLDSYQVYQWYLATPNLCQVPFPLYNYYSGLAQAGRL